MKIGDSVKLADGKIATVVAIHEDELQTIVAAFDDTWVLVSAGMYEVIDAAANQGAEQATAASDTEEKKE